MSDTNDWNVKIDDVVKINTDAGDTLLVSLPAASERLPLNELDQMYVRVAKAFEGVFADKDVRVIVVPHDMKVELIKSSNMENK